MDIQLLQAVYLGTRQLSLAQPGGLGLRPISAGVKAADARLQGMALSRQHWVRVRADGLHEVYSA